MLTNVSVDDLRSVAVDATKLASNFPTVFTDCYGLQDASLKSEIVNQFPLVSWLLSTSLSNRMRSDAMSGIHHLHMDSNGNWVLEIPRQIWTELPTSTADECCWLPFDFAKCAGNVPINLLCLKDCDKILNILIGENLRMGERVNVPGIAGPNDTLDQVRVRVARLSMAYFTAYTIMLGLDNTYTDVLKPFHGLLQLLENPAVTTFYGGDILDAFKTFACRARILGDTGSYVAAAHPLVIQAIRDAVVPGMNGELPEGWTKTEDSISFMGMRFIEDKWVPVDKTSNTGELWILSGNHVGAYMATDLAPADAFIRKTGAEATVANGCFTECTYYYNFGTTFNDDARRIMKMVEIPISGDCTAAISDIWGIATANTLIPNGKIA